MRIVKYPFNVLLLLTATLTLIQCDSSVVDPAVEKKSATITGPRLLEPTNNAEGQPASLKLSWNEVQEASQYQILISENEDFSSPIVDNHVQSTEYSINGLSYEQKYFWKVRALNRDSAVSNWSESWNFTTSQKPAEEPILTTTLESPENEAKDQSVDVTLTWSKVVKATGYQVQVAQDSAFSTTAMDVTVDTTSYNASGLSHGQSYYWRVKPQVESGKVQWSAINSFSTSINSTSSQDTLQATLTTPEDGSSDLSISPTLEWESIPEATEYSIQLDTEDSFSDPVTSTSIQSTSYQTDGLSHETTYYWRVKPKSDSDGDVEKWSTIWTFKTKAAPVDENPGAPSSSDVWMTAYFAYWNHSESSNGGISSDAIDWNAFTHMNYFALLARSDGSLSGIGNNQNVKADHVEAIVSAGHQHDKPVLFTIGGWGNYDGWSGAIRPGNRSLFINNIVSIIQQWGFDGVDLDMEPIRSSDFDNYIAFVNELYAALQSINTPMLSKPLITVATSTHGNLFSSIHDKIDQINLMTYDFSGAWDGWVSWHNSAISDGGLTFPGLSRLLPSANGAVQEFLNAGVPAKKIGIGIDFYGYVWSGGSGTSTGGVTRPNQAWLTAPSVTDNVPYNDIMDQYYTENRRHWDGGAQAVYLSINEQGSSNDKFISYDDEQTIQAKVDYIRQNGLGGAIIWELGGGYRSNQPAGSRDKLLQAVKKAVW